MVTYHIWSNVLPPLGHCDIYLMFVQSSWNVCLNRLSILCLYWSCLLKSILNWDIFWNTHSRPSICLNQALDRRILKWSHSGIWNAHLSLPDQLSQLILVEMRLFLDEVIDLNKIL